MNNGRQQYLDNNYEKIKIKYEPSQSIHVALSSYAPEACLGRQKIIYLSNLFSF